MRKIYTIFFCCILLCSSAFFYNAVAQNTYADSVKYLSVPGPANQDTTKFATFYVMRPHNEIAKTFWMGIYVDDTSMVRVEDDMRCVIKCAKTGNVNVWIKNDQVSSLTINVEPGKKYYLQMNTEAGGKTGATKLVQLNEKDGEDAFNKISSLPLYVYDPDPFTNGYYTWPSSPKIGYAHMKFSLPLSARHYFVSTLDGFKFRYANKNVSPTFSEIDGVYGLKMKFSDREDFDKYADKQIGNIKKGFTKSETLQQLTADSLTSAADFISSVYFTTKDTKPSVVVNGSTPVLELRQYSALIYKKDANTGKGDIYSIYFSERGLPQELHSKEEIRFKIQQLINSCEFGDFK